MATTSVPAMNEERNIHSGTVHCDDPELSILIDKVNETLSKPVTFGQVWDRGWYLPEELELTDKQHQQLRDVDVGASEAEIQAALAQ